MHGLSSKLRVPKPGGLNRLPEFFFLSCFFFHFFLFTSRRLPFTRLRASALSRDDRTARRLPRTRFLSARSLASHPFLFDDRDQTVDSQTHSASPRLLPNRETPRQKSGTQQLVNTPIQFCKRINRFAFFFALIASAALSVGSTPHIETVG